MNIGIREFPREAVCAALYVDNLSLGKQNKKDKVKFAKLILAIEHEFGRNYSAFINMFPDKVHAISTMVHDLNVDFPRVASEHVSNEKVYCWFTDQLANLKTIWEDGRGDFKGAVRFLCALSDASRKANNIFHPIMRGVALPA